jgi:periplasmic protein TonB
MSYTEQKRPQKTVSLAAALALNGSIIAAIMLSPMVVNPPEDKLRTTATVVAPEKIPPEKKVEPKSEPRPLPPLFTPPTPFDYKIDKQQPVTSQDPPPDTSGLKDGKGMDDAPGFDIPQKDPPPPPIFKRAVRDNRFAGDFQPSYPPGLLVREIEGSATIRVLVGTDGRVREAKVVSATHPDFGKAAVRQALKAWRFKPATRGGEAVEDWLTLPVSFVIN